MSDYKKMRDQMREQLDAVDAANATHPEMEGLRNIVESMGSHDPGLLGTPPRVVLELSREHALALLYAYEINEYPTSNPLGDAGGGTLAEAEAILTAALGGRDAITQFLYSDDD